MPLAPAARLVRAAALSWERDARADIAEGADLSRHLLGYVRRWLPALAAGYVVREGRALRLTAAGVALLAETHAARAAERAAYDLMIAESYEVARQVEAMRRAQLEARARELAAVDRLQELLGELGALRDGLDGLDACAPGHGRCTATMGKPLRQIRLPQLDRCGLTCWSRQASCIEPRRQPALRILAGGRMVPTSAQVKARKDFEQERALHQLLLAGRRYRGSWGWWPMAGADLAPFLSNTRKLRRHQRPLFALGLLEQDAMVHERSEVRLTAKGTAWLVEQLRAEPAGAPVAPAVALAA